MDVDALDKLRDQLAAALVFECELTASAAEARAAVEKLWPVVDRIANVRAAAELEAAADECEGESSHAYDEDDEAYEDSARRLRDRAAALRASNGEGA